MIKIHLFRKNGNIIGFEASGHSGYASEGSDIVCSAVSALTQTTALGLEKRLNLPLYVSIGSESMRCMLEHTETKQLEQAAVLFDTLLLGLRAIEGSYGEYLSITEKEV